MSLENMAGGLDLASPITDHLASCILRHMPGPFAVYDSHLRCLMATDRYLAGFGLRHEDIVGRSLRETIPALPSKWRDTHHRCLSGAAERCDDDSLTRADGSVERCCWECSPWREPNGGIGGIVVYLEITTERRQLEAQALAVHRLDAAGQAAGQLAHDFNNLLVPLAAYPELIKMQLPEGHPAARFCDDMLRSVQQWVEFNERLLARAIGDVDHGCGTRREWGETG